MTIHRNYARLNAADRKVVDDAYDAAISVMTGTWGRKVSFADHAERFVEAIATYLIESGGAARVGNGETLTAPEGAEHPSYGA